MKNKISRTIYGIFCLVAFLYSQNIHGQDPGFSQYMASPLSISPALTGNFDANWRATSVIRNQWTGIGAPYRTKTLSVESKIRNEHNEDYWGLGGMVLLDEAMDGIYKSTYITLNAAYHLFLDDNGNALAAGLGYINNKTLINFTELTFDQQLSNMGFNRALPQGEPSLSNNPSFSSVCAGFMYSFSKDNIYANIGLSGYRFIKSKKSILDDATQYDSPRYAVHADLSTLLTERMNLSVSGLYTTQNGQSNTIFGGVFSFVHLAPDDLDVSKSLNLGAFYRLGNALIPYAGYEYKNFQVGITYDINTGLSKTASLTSRTFEISFTYKQSRQDVSKAGKYHSPY